MRWIVCLLLVSMWLLGQFTGFSIADQPHLPLLGAAGLLLTRQRHAADSRPATPAVPHHPLGADPAHPRAALGH